MTGTISPGEHRRTLEHTLNDWAHGYNLSSAFSDVLEMLVCEFTPHQLDPDTQQLRGRYTDKYLAVVKRYDPDHVRKYYPPLCKAIFAVYDTEVTAEGGWCDPLGDYFEQTASQKDRSWKGQFFTPPSVCELMAALTGPAQEEHQTDASLLDPACGSGRCLIAYDRSIPPRSNNFYVGVDIDARCVQMAAINFFFHGMRGVLICGNSLSMEMRFGYRVWHPLMGIGIEHLDEQDCLSFLVSRRHTDANNQDIPTGKSIEGPGGQLLLF
ncbi:MAG: N-6 DNA methylase [Bacteroidota bacterium]